MNWLDIAIIVIIAIGMLRGLITGIVKQIIALVSLVAAILLSGAVAKWINLWVHTHFQNENTLFSPNVENIIYYVLAFTLIISLFTIAAKLVDKIISYTPAGIINRIFGAIFGAFMWTLCLSIFLNFIAVFDNQARIIPKSIKENSLCYEYVKMLSPTIFPYVKDFLCNK